MFNKETGAFSAVELKTMESLNFSKVQSQIKHYSTLDYHLQLRGPARKAFLSNPDFFKNLKIPTSSQFHVSTLEPFDVPKSIQNIDRSLAYFSTLHSEKSISFRALLLKLFKL